MISSKGGFPPNIRTGLYINTIGQPADVFLIPDSSPDAHLQWAAEQELMTNNRYLRGQTPLYLPNLAPGKYVFHLRLNTPIPHPPEGYPEGEEHRGPIKFAGPWVKFSSFNEARLTSLKGEVEVTSDEAVAVIIPLIPYRASSKDMDSLYPQEPKFYVKESSIRAALVNNSFLFPDNDIAWIVDLLRRGGAIVIKDCIFINVFPARDSFIFWANPDCDKRGIYNVAPRR